MYPGEQGPVATEPGATREAEGIPLTLVVPPVLGVLVGLYIAADTSHAFPIKDYYTTAAQVIPVLILVFAVETAAQDFPTGTRVNIFRAMLVIFLIGGELFALLGASGALRESTKAVEMGEVAASVSINNLIAAGTTAGLVGGFIGVALLALVGTRSLIVSFSRPDPRQATEIERLRAQLAEVQSRLDGEQRPPDESQQ